VARPDDWTAIVVRLGAALFFVVALLVVLVGRPPEAWVTAVGGRVPIVRAVLAILVLFVWSRGRAIAYAALPATPVLLWRRIRVPGFGLVDIDTIAEVEVARRTNGEVFVLRHVDGSRRDLCPVQWPGAGRLYASLARKVARARRAAYRKTTRGDTKNESA